MAGVSRRILESVAPEKQGAAVRRELIILARAYVAASTVRPSSEQISSAHLTGYRMLPS